MSEQLDLLPLEDSAAGLYPRLKIDWYSPIYNMHMYWTKQKPEIIAKFIQKYSKPGDTVMDAFCGSGMTGVAALMTERNVILSDLSPLSVFLSKNFTSQCDVKMLMETFKRIIDELEDSYSWLSNAECHICSSKNAHIGAVIWADDFRCPECGHIQNLCEDGSHLRLKKGQTIDSLECKKCGHEYEKAMKYFAGTKPISIEVNCADCGTSGKEGSRRLTRKDHKQLRRIDNFQIKDFVPYKVKFPEGINTKRCLLRGIDHPYQIFSKANLIRISGYWQRIEKLARAVRGCNF